MAKTRIQLSATETAYVGLVHAEHEGAMMVANGRRAERFSVLLRDKGIPGANAEFIPPALGGPALEYEIPDIAPAPEQAIENVPEAPLLSESTT